MRVLVTGASSLPGYRTVEELIKRGHEVIATYLNHDVAINHPDLTKVRMDVRDLDLLSKVFEQRKPYAVIHMAAYGDVDGCERDKRKAWEVNALGTANMVRLSLRYSKFFLYLSTDYVFDGKRGSYREDDPPNPVNYYGLTKLCGEAVSLSSSIPNAVIRGSSIYGLGPGRKNFAKFLIERLSKGDRVKALTDQYTTPSHATLLAKAVVEVTERMLEGVFHVVGERCSRYEFASMVAEKLGLDKGLIEGATLSDFNWLASRPRDSSLDCGLTMRAVKTDFHSMSLALETLKREYEEGGLEG